MHWGCRFSAEKIQLGAVADCIEKAKAEGKGAFFCMPPAAGEDSSALQTFMAVQNCETIDGKGITQKKIQGTPIEEVMEDVRKQVVNAMKHGKTLYIDLRNGAPGLTTDYSSDDKFPLEIWGATDHTKVALTVDVYSPTNTAHERPNCSSVRVCICFAQCEELIAKIVLDDEKESGMFVAKEGYNLVLSSSFQIDDYKEFLDGAQTVPWDKVLAFEVEAVAE